MKNRILILLIIGILASLSSCHKDYPKDIPDWLKDMIKDRKKECRNEGCNCTQNADGCWRIYEWIYQGELYYYKVKTAPYDQEGCIYYEVYDSDGTLLCNDAAFCFTYNVDGPVCQGIFTNGTQVREIWIQDGN